ncbi:uncharacterized protein V1518DRAFT_422192 [Limtongia smithiae]|uniref:uncharacterized protein n=1 Tax=Limtongia smithiae TaxID=1125753 RepID=UPI0034CED2D3
MHRQNPYKDRTIDFRALADFYPPLKEHLDEGGSIKFTDHAAVCSLTQALLARDFKLEVELSAEHLCPRVPNRLNYICWIEDLLASDKFDDSCKADPKSVVGLDIGTGISCIYPLLGCRMHEDWRFVATDISPEAIALANANVKRNGLELRICVTQTTLESQFFQNFAVPFDTTVFDFSMCNPPFYSSENDLAASNSNKASAAKSFTRAVQAEIITPGGEAAMVTRMICESLAVSHSHPETRRTWYTSMLGKLESLQEVVARLHEKKIDNFVVAEFVQGEHTRRWAVAWRFDLRRPLPGLCRPPDVSVKVRALLPLPCLTRIDTTKNTTDDLSLESILSKITTAYGDNLHVHITENKDTGEYILGTSPLGDVWSRKFRRNNKRRKLESDENRNLETSSGETPRDSAFAFRIFVEDARHIFVHWKYGAEYAVYESFTGMLRALLNK